MNREELLNSITQIGTCEDENERRNLLTTLSENVGNVFNEVDTLRATNTTLEDTIKTKTEELEKSQNYNMEMFLKLQKQNEVKPMEVETGIKEEEKPVYKSYKELGQSYLK